MGKKVAVIMAGGSGERFWPLSRKSVPKQLLNLHKEDKSLIQEAIERILPIINAEDIFIVTSEILLEPIRRNLSILPAENIIAEPAKRNTAPCLALAAGFLAERYKSGYKPNEISIAVLTADHIIQPQEKFCNTVNSALDYALNNDVLATIGIKPTMPHTGFGYIETDFDAELIPYKAFKAKSFHEKPSKATAEKFVESGNFFWNSGMFFFRLDFFISSLIKYLPEVGTKISEIELGYENKTKLILSESNRKISEIFEQMPSISIDYGLMEKAENIAVFVSDFIWDDIGSWDAIERHRSADENGNISQGLTELIDTHNSVIINSGTTRKVVTAIDVNSLTIVVTDDAVLICPKDKLQKVKLAVESLRNHHLDEFL